MECAEYRRIITTNVPSEITRAERAATLAHFCRCESCSTWIPPFQRELTLAEKARVNVLTEADYNDPEFLCVIKDALRGHKP